MKWSHPLILSLLSLSMLAGTCERSNPVQPTLRVFFPKKIERLHIDPLNYHEMTHLNLVLQLYSRLIEYNNEAQITGGMAKSWYWEGSTLVFNLRLGLISSRGESIDSGDVVATFQRIASTQYDKYKVALADLCPSVDEQQRRPCENIWADGPHRVHLKFSKPKPAVVDLFASLDFAIVPRSAISRVDPREIDITNTSGPYAVNRLDEQAGTLELAAQRGHWHWRRDMPQLVEIKTFVHDGKIVNNPEDTVKAFLNRKVDLIGTISVLREVPASLRDQVAYSVFTSSPIGVVQFVFSREALARYSVEQRLAIAFRMRKLFAAARESEARRADGLFPLLSDGDLLPEQKQAWENKIKAAAEASRLPGKVRLPLPPHVRDLRDVFDRDPDFFQYDRDSPSESAAVAPVYDGSFMFISLAIESGDALIFLKRVGMLPFSAEESDEYIQKFYEAEDREERVRLLRRTHEAILNQGLLVPLEELSYHAIARKPWTLHFSPAFFDTPLWQVRYTP